MLLHLVPLAASDLGAARSQMAFTLGFHIILASLGVAFPAMMLIANYRGLRHNDEAALRLARRWSHDDGAEGPARLGHRSSCPAADERRSCEGGGQLGGSGDDAPAGRADHRGGRVDLGVTGFFRQP